MTMRKFALSLILAAMVSPLSATASIATENQNLLDALAAPPRYKRDPMAAATGSPWSSDRTQWPLMMVCTLKEVRAGKTLSYTFINGPEDKWLETGMRKNGSTLTHAENRRPVWTHIQPPDMNFARLVYDTQYALGITTTWKRVEGDDYVIKAKAALVKKGTVIARGTCAWGISYAPQEDALKKEFQHRP